MTDEVSADLEIYLHYVYGLAFTKPTKPQPLVVELSYPKRSEQAHILRIDQVLTQEPVKALHEKYYVAIVAID